MYTWHWQDCVQMCMCIFVFVYVSNNIICILYICNVMMVQLQLVSLQVAVAVVTATRTFIMNYLGYGYSKFSSMAEAVKHESWAAMAIKIAHMDLPPQWLQRWGLPRAWQQTRWECFILCTCHLLMTKTMEATFIVTRGSPLGSSEALPGRVSWYQEHMMTVQ